MNEAILSKLVCPLSRGPLIYGSGNDELLSERAGLAYPVKNGVPVLLIEQARRLDREAAQEKR